MKQLSILFISLFIFTTFAWGEPMKEKLNDDNLKKKLTPLQYDVTQKGATETPFRNEYWDKHDAGIYVDVVTGEPLFSSTDKFDSGTGWPSFSKPIDPQSITEKADHSLGMQRVEILSAAGASHLGHVFDDGPKPSGMRYCVNSASLRFIPADKLEEEGYGKFKYLFAPSHSPSGSVGETPEQSKR